MRCFAVVVLCAAAWIAAPSSQTRSERTVPQEQQASQTFLYTVYPELRATSLSIAVVTTTTGMHLEVVEALASPLVRPPKSVDPLMAADFTTAKTTRSPCSRQPANC